MEWEKYRKPDGAINLNLAFDNEVLAKNEEAVSWNVDAGYTYIESIERMQPIVSRQAAAIILATAESLSQLFLEE